MIPFVPFPINKTIKFSRPFYGLGNAIAKAMPTLKLNMYQAELDIHPREYCSVIIFSSVFYFVLFSFVVYLIGFVFKAPNIFLSLGIGSVLFIFVFSYLLNWPKLIANRRMKLLERDLLNAMHHILIEIKSGVPLFNALLGASEGYGEISDEFKKIIKEINAGTPEVEALDIASRRNPSLFFRRAIWQMVNALRAGSDIATALEAILDALLKEQIIAIRRYGQELNPFTMMYMLVAVILPSLGITFMIILTSFSGITIPKMVLPLVLIALALFQFFYMGLIKTKRPIMEV